MLDSMVKWYPNFAIWDRCSRRMRIFFCPKTARETPAVQKTLLIKGRKQHCTLRPKNGEYVEYSFDSLSDMPYTVEDEDRVSPLSTT
jgi:hypothetical protein